MTITKRLIDKFSARVPDVVIGGQKHPYLLRWFVIPRNRFFNIYVHCFLRSDDDRAHHSHPWLFNASLLLSGSYIEHTIKAGGIVVRTHRVAGCWKVRFGAAPHRIELLTVAHYVITQPLNSDLIPCWTLFITGPRMREWGFYCMERGWIHWKRFMASEDSGAIGKGCEAETC